MTGTMGRQLFLLKMLPVWVSKSSVWITLPTPNLNAWTLSPSHKQEAFISPLKTAAKTGKGRRRNGRTGDSFHFEPWILCRKPESTPMNGILKELYLSINQQIIIKPYYVQGSMRGPQEHSFQGILGISGRSKGFEIRSWASKNFSVKVSCYNLLYDPQEERKVNK